MKLLLVSIAFPPKNDPESFQVEKYLKELFKLNYRISVITSKSPTLWMPLQKDGQDYMNNLIQKIEIPVYEPKYLSIFIAKFFPFLMYPDNRLTFFIQWRRAFKQLQEVPDIIYSRSFPLSSTIMGYFLAKKMEKPWILHLSDPWVENPIFNYQGIQRKIHLHWEKKCFKLAKRIAFTSESTMDIYARNYPEISNKFFLSFNSYEPDLTKKMPKEGSSKMVFAYTGSLNGSRSLKTLVLALEYLKTSNFPIYDDIIIKVAGSADKENMKIISSNDRIVHYGLLSTKEVLKIQQQANVFISVDFEFEDSKCAQFFPSKLLDYFKFGKPIIAITNLGSETSRVVDERYGWIIEHGDYKSLADLFINLHSKNISSMSYSPPKLYQTKEVVHKLHEIFNNEKSRINHRN